MKSFLIKIGKAWSVIKRDGIFSGSKRVLLALIKLYKKVEKGDVLIITDGVGDSAIYRAWNHAEELNFNKIKTSVATTALPNLEKYVKDFKVFIFHRTLFTEKIESFIKKIKEQKKEIIFETDDLVYDPKFLSEMEYFKSANSFEKKLYKNGLGGEILRDNYVKVCTTTTKFLAEKLKSEGKKVFIVKNKLAKKEVFWAKEALDKKIENDSDEIKLGYFSGTLSHNRDFAIITDVLKKILAKYSNVKLFLAGPLNPDSSLLKDFSEQVFSLPFVEKKKHFKNIANVDINLAPLEMTAFCQSKSELKFFEAGIVKVPTVASATETFVLAIEDGKDGFVARNDKEWFDKIEKLILDKKLRISIGKKAYEKTILEYTTEKGKSESYYDYLRKIIGIN